MKDIDEKYLPAIQKKEIETWVIKGAIPLLNLMFHIHAETTSEEQRLACHHAIKMFVIMIGEFGPQAGKFDEDKFTVDVTGEYDDFIKNCSELRNFYAHKVPLDKLARVDEQLFRLVEAAKKLNPAFPLTGERNLAERLSPHSVKKHYEKAVKSRKSVVSQTK